MADNTDDRRDGAFPPEIVAKIAAMGANFNPEVLAATMELYRPLVKRHSAAKVAVTADVAFVSSR